MWPLEGDDSDDGGTSHGDFAINQKTGFHLEV